MRTRPSLLVLWLCACALACAQPLPPPAHAQTPVEVAKSSTSIYIGSVSLALDRLARTETGYAAAYHARVFPFFFESESGQFSIEFSDDQLRQIERGEQVAFTGTARNHRGRDRRITGRVTPTDAQSGAIKVRIFVTEKIRLVFETTYRFAEK